MVLAVVAMADAVAAKESVVPAVQGLAVQGLGPAVQARAVQVQAVQVPAVQVVPDEILSVAMVLIRCLPKANPILRTAPDRLSQTAGGTQALTYWFLWQSLFPQSGLDQLLKRKGLYDLLGQ